MELTSPDVSSRATSFFYVFKFPQNEPRLVPSVVLSSSGNPTTQSNSLPAQMFVEESAQKNIPNIVFNSFWITVSAIKFFFVVA